jgi:hypothetical protein
MPLSMRTCLAACALLASPAAPAARSAAPPPRVVVVTVESSLPSAGRHIRQLAFDGDPGTWFATAKNPGPADHFTLRFDSPVAVASLHVTTGRPDGRDRLHAGILEVSSSGMTFTTVARFVQGEARVAVNGKRLLAVRVRPESDLKCPLTIREIAIDSSPAVATFRYPVEFTVNVDDAPAMKGWAEKTARLCERWYPRISDELRSPGYRPPQQVTMTLRKNYRGVAAAGGGRIVGSVQWFSERPRDVGAMIHETVHIVQNYRRGNNPGWLVEGIADYIRFFKYEPGKLGRINPKRARYSDSYRTSAAFLAWLTEKHDPDIVRKLNQAMRAGEYRDELFKKWTGKTVQELGQEWRATLR